MRLPPMCGTLQIMRRHHEVGPPNSAVMPVTIAVMKVNAVDVPIG